MASPRKSSRYWLVAALPILVVICALVAVRIVNSMDYHHNDNDFFTFWLAGHLAAQGGSPYDTAQWMAGYRQFEMDVIPNPAFLYPLPLALLFAPLGLLPFHSAYVVWVTLLQLMIVASLAILLSLQANPRAKLFFIPLLAGIVLFRPTTLTLTQGQVSGLFLFVLVGVAFLWQRGKWGWGGILLGLLALKPNLGLIVIVLAALWLLLRKRWRGLLGIAVTGTVLLAAGLLYDPRWPLEYWQVGSHKLAQTFGGSPTVWGLGALTCRLDSPCTLALGGIAALLLILGFLWLIVRRADLSPVAVIGLAATVTLLVAPYTWTYDQLLLIIPIIAITLAVDGPGRRFLLAAGIFMIVDIEIVFVLFFDTLLGVEIFNAFIPLIVLGLLVGFALPPQPPGD